MNRSPWYYVSIVLLTLVVIAAIGLVGYFVYFIRGILPPFVIAFVIAWLLDPVLDRLQKRGVPRIAAVAGVYVVFLALFVVGVIFLVPLIVGQAQDLANDLPHQYDRFRHYVAGFMETHHDFLLKHHLPTTLQEALDRYGEKVAPYAERGIRSLSHVLVANISKLLWLVLIPLSAFYFLNDIDRIKAKSVLFIPEKHRSRVTAMTSRVGQVFSNYVRGLLVTCLLYGVSTTVVLSVLGLKYGIILGLLAGILYAVPYIGAISTAVLVFLVGLATYQHSPLAWAGLAAACMVILNQVFDLLISPKILGKSVGLHPVLSLFALMAGGALFKLPGMVLAVPVAASIQEIIFELYPELRGHEKRKRARRKKAEKRK